MHPLSPLRTLLYRCEWTLNDMRLRGQVLHRVAMQPCKFYAAGKCIFGAACKFSHNIPVGINATCVPPPSSTPPASVHGGAVPLSAKMLEEEDIHCTPTGEEGPTLTI